jgi:preprotein translocase subunit SecF
MAAQQQHHFFEIIKPGTDIDLIGKQRIWIGASVVLTLLTIAMLIANAFFIPGRGHVLNWGVDFRGGTEITIEFARNIDDGAARGALEKAGYHNAEVVRFGDRPNSFLIRMGSVSVISAAQAEKAKAALSKVGDATLVPSERGFKWSEGGDKLYLRFDKPVELETLTAALKAAGVPTTAVRQFGRAEDHNYEVTLVGLDSEVTKAFEAGLGAGSVAKVHGVASVGEKAGKELQLAGLQALVGAILLIVIYVAVRFDFRYGPGTIVALLHDAVLTIGAFAITYKEFSLTTLAALLTIIGFSMNDTIVVFDRIRENAARYRDRRFDKVVNQSINETLSRTILTSATVFFVTLAMNIFGTGVIRDFAFAMNVGVIVGTYSSIFIASPILIWLNDKYNQSQKKQSQRPERARRPVRQEEEPAET